MSFNGSGSFLINTAGQPVVSGTVISSTAFNALTADLATGLSTCITKDGQTTVTANIPMANYKFTGLGAGSGAADSANLSQVQSTVVKLLASVSGTDTITAVGSPTVSAYAAGQMFYFVAAGDNTGAVTINIDSLGAKAVTRDGSVALAAGDIKSGEVVVIVYDGTRFQVVSQLNSSGDARFANVSIASALNVGGVATVTGGSVLNGGVVINEPGADVDFRVEGDTDANLVFVDASADAVGISTNAPATKLHLGGATNKSIRIDSANGNAGFFGTYQSETNIAANRNPSTGTFTDTAKAAATIKLNANNLDGNITFSTTALNNTEPTERAVIDKNGNLGLGVTPSAWASSWKVFQSQGGFVGSNATSGYFISNNSYSDGTNWRRVSAEAASQYLQSAGAHSWYTAGSSTAGSTITFTQAMTLDASGNLSNDGNYTSTGAGNTRYIGFNFYGNLQYNFYVDGTSDAAAMLIRSGTTERARFTSDGILLVGKTTASLATAGVSIESNGTTACTVSGGQVLIANRNTNDGTIVSLRQDQNEEGSISVSGNTVSYNAFAGSHWSQLQDGSKPDILRGTVMESINELCEWPDETNERLPKSKVSDTAGSKKVYGVFMAWDNDWTATNDMYVTAVGAFICRVNGSVTVQEGDLLESNGDGTARVQADDIIRSSTIGKVTSTVKTHQYDDGSYCVPTVLYCG